MFTIIGQVNCSVEMSLRSSMSIETMAFMHDFGEGGAELPGSGGAKLKCGAITNMG